MPGERSKKRPEEVIREALRKQSLGFTVVEVKETVEVDDSGKSKTKKERTKRFVPPNLGALQMWKELDAQGEGGVTVLTQVPRPDEEGRDET